MKFLSATLASVVGAASADPAIIAMPAAVQPQMQPATTFLTAAGAQPVYVATQPRLVAAAAAQPALLEQQVMRTPQMATVPHLYNVHHPQAQVVAAPVLRQQIIPAVAPQQYVNAETIKVVEQQPRAGEEVSQQYHSQDEFGNYSYGYANNNSEKQEVGNTRSGQVKGHYTYVDGAGRNRRVDYVADNNGFRAAGDGINKIKREAEPEAEPEAKPEAKAEAEPEADPKMVQMTSYVNNNGKQEGIKMSSYMTDNTMQHQQQPSMRMSSMMRPSSMMTYTNDMSSMPMSNPMVYMSMNAPGGATLTASRMTNNNNMYNMQQQRNHQMDNMRMMDSMRMDNMGMDNMRMDRNDIMMRRNNMLNMGRNDMRMNTMGMNNRDMYRMMNHRAGLRGQQQQQYLNNMHRGRDMLMRDSMFKTNPSNNFMEIQQFEMKPNYNYRFDF